MNLTPEKIFSYAPDAGTVQRAKSVAHAQIWHTLEGNGRVIWGTYGYVADPFFVQVDFEGPAFKCTCPVRRKPCKHAIGLLLLFSKNNDAFKVATDLPEWVNNWIEKRDARSSKKKTNQTPKRSPEAEAALAEKRKETRQNRLYQMEAGLTELESWLNDLFRQGLASLEGHSDKYWQLLAARMVDSKLGGIARRIRQFPLLMVESDWHEKLLAELGDIYLIVKGFQNLENLPEPLQDDLLSLAGVNFKKAEVLEGELLHDTWLVAGQTETIEEGNLMARRTWLIGENSGQNVLLLDFAWGGNPYEVSYKLGTVLSGEVAFYPSAYPQRVLLKNFEFENKPFDLSNGYSSFQAFAESYAVALSKNPWLSFFPVFFQNVTPAFIEAESATQNDTFVIVDKDKKQLPMSVSDGTGWKIMAYSCGHPLGIFGTWDGKLFRPLSVVVDGLFKPLENIEQGFNY